MVTRVQLATEEEYSEISTDADGDEEETTIYFDAEEGRLEMPDGTTLEVVSDNEEEDDGEAQGEEEEEEGGEGSRTPQATASTAQATGVQRDRETITSTSDNATAPTARPGILRRASSATQRRVSHSFLCSPWLIFTRLLRCSNPAADSTTFEQCRDTRDFPAWWNDHAVWIANTTSSG